MCINGIHCSTDEPTVFSWSMVSLEDFLAYTHIKAYDVISGGNFKRHLSNARENGDKWAIDMNNGQSAVQAKIREVFSLVSHLSGPQTERVQRVCKDVMSCAQPPIKVLTGFNVCSLTGVSSEHCIDLTRPGKNTREVLVHPRFRHFFMFLWFCAKSEYIIRACTKQWVEGLPAPPCPETYTRLCEEYHTENLETNEKMYRLFLKGVDYVTLSLRTFKDSWALQPTLVPPPEYLDLDQGSEGSPSPRKKKHTNHPGPNS